MKLIIAALALAGSPAEAMATSAPSTQAAITAVDPARLAEATLLVDAIMPPETREAMITGMVSPLMQTITTGIKNQPNLQGIFDKEPEVSKIFDKFIARQHDRTLELLRAELPAMVTAMAKAYARRLSSAEMTDATAFFSSPAGRAYMNVSTSVMADPDVIQWQSNMMAASLQNSPAEIEKLKNEVQAYLDKKDGAAKKEKARK